MLVCRVCLTESGDESIEIFGGEGLSLDIAGMLNKHFSFQPTFDDPISTSICYYCWVVISNFDEFHSHVHQIQRRLAAEQVSYVEKENRELGEVLDALEVNEELPNDLEKEGELIQQPQGEILSEEKAPQNEAEGEPSSKESSKEPKVTLKEPNDLIGDPAEASKEPNGSICGPADPNGASLPCEQIKEPSEGPMIAPENPKEASKKTLVKRWSQRRIDRGIMCEFCSKIVYGESAFARHQQQEHATHESALKFQCEQCGRWLKNKVTLRKHKQRHRTGEFECHICGKTLPNSVSLKRHQQHMHGSKPRHECPQCNKAFKKKLSLKEHMTTHTGETLYKCPHCPCTFNSNANMHSHRKKRHPIEFAETRRRRLEQNFAAN